ncbi:MAG: AIPR family protein, partial [Bacteroidales bacterium]|nr:AIPR family protein [Bacteroidales bacterium]
IGYITAEELLNCIAPTSDKSTERVLYPDVFKNNIRLYLGTTPINKNIERTLIDEPNKFHLYNNGLTITTKSIDPGNVNYYEISPVNIVNGCQTANSVYNIFKVKSDKEKEVKIPVKIIIAQDEEYEKITIRTNSQNGLSEQDLVSITNIQKELEDTFHRIIIQNYSFQYKRQNSAEIQISDEIDFIVTINDILRASFSCLMLIPHKVSGYFDTTTGKYIDNIFEERFLKLYYVTTVALKLIEEELEQSNPTLVRLKYHISYLLYKLSNKGVAINEVEKYFRKKTASENLSEEEILEQDKIIETIYSNLYLVIKDKEIFQKTIKYIIDILKNEYVALTTIDTKDKEKILYKTVDSVQRGEKVFGNFDEKFKKTIKEIIQD